MYSRYFKRFADISGSIFLIFLLSPIILIVILLISVKLGNPVFFMQKRPGKFGVPFNMIKFRTMTNQRDHQGRLLPDSERMTRLGRFLRSSSIDELPELWNVLKGDMSLIGPRPLLMEYLPLYNEQQAKRHDIRPGITGLAQVMGRNSIAWEQKFTYDIEYVDNLSFALDCKILQLTLLKVIKKEGISQAGHETSAKFRGNLK